MRLPGSKAAEVLIPAGHERTPQVRGHDPHRVPHGGERHHPEITEEQPEAVEVGLVREAVPWT